AQSGISDPGQRTFVGTAAMAALGTLESGQVAQGAADVIPCGVLGARVAADGRLLLGSGVVTVDHVAIGEHAVEFGLDIASRYMSLVANGHPGENSGEPGRDPNTVYVETFTSAGRPADGTFYLVPACPANAQRVLGARVAADGTLLLGSGVVAVRHVAAG